MPTVCFKVEAIGLMLFEQHGEFFVLEVPKIHLEIIAGRFLSAGVGSTVMCQLRSCDR